MATPRLREPCPPRGLSEGPSPFGPAIVCMLFLLVYFFPFWTTSGALARIGNDFHSLYANYATYYAETLAHGIVPWWNPSEGAGFPFHSNPFAAFFYPVKLVTVSVAALTGQYTWYHHQVYMVAGLLWFGLGVCLWLQRRGVSGSAATIAAITVAISYRMADIYRFPNAVHVIAWLPWLLYAFEHWLHGRVSRGLLLGVVAAVCMVTAGYPYYAVYGFLFFLGYLVLRWFEQARSPEVFLRAAAILTPSCLLTAPHMLGIRQLLDSTVDRDGTSYAFSVHHSWSHTDLIGGLVFPPSANSEGWLYLGILPLLLIGWWLWHDRPRTAETAWSGFTIFGIQLLATGSQSFLFPILWAHVPLLGSLRVWPRATIVLLLPLALMLARAYDCWRAQEALDRGFGTRIVAIGGGVLVVQLILWGTRTFHARHEQAFSFMEPVSFVVQVILSVVILLVLTYVGNLPKISVANPMVAACLIAGLIALDVGQYGRNIWRSEVGVSLPGARPNATDYFLRFLSDPRADRVGMLVPYAPTAGVMANWYYQRYVQFVERYKDAPSFDGFMGRDGRKLFFVQELDAAPEKFEEWWHRQQEFERAAQARRSRARFNGSVLSVEYRTTAPGYLLWVDNWDLDWRAEVNGVAAEILRPFGTFKAVHLEPGQHHVTFFYRPSFPVWWLTPVGLLLLLAELAIAAGTRQWRWVARATTLPRAHPDEPSSAAPGTPRSFPPPRR